MLLLRALYFFQGISVGIIMPFLALHFKQRGFLDWQIGVLSGIGPLVTILLAGFLGMLADRTVNRNRLLVGTLVLQTAVFVGVIAASHFAWVVLSNVAYAIAGALTGALMTAGIIIMARDRGSDFGKVRVWLSIGFVASSLVGGAIVDLFSTTAVLAAALASMAIVAGLSALLPPLARPPAVVEPGAARRRDLLQHREIMSLMLSCFLSRLAMGTYLVFFTIHLNEAGYSASFISALWGLSVAAEVGVAYKSQELVRRFGARRIIAAAYVGEAIRWGAFAVTSAWPVLVLVQLSHGLSFGGGEMGNMYFIDQRFPARFKVSGQSYRLIMMSSGFLIGSLLAGWACGTMGRNWAFGLSAIVASAGALVAFIGMRDTMTSNVSTSDEEREQTDPDREVVCEST